jgi:hypothetical protein
VGLDRFGWIMIGTKKWVGWYDVRHHVEDAIERVYGSFIDVYIASVPFFL